MGHSWNEHEHPRDRIGRFAGAPGGGGTSTGGGSRANRVTTGSGHTVTISRNAGNGQTWSAGGQNLTLDEHDSKVLGDELGYLTLVGRVSTSGNRDFTVGSSRAIPYKGGPNDDGGPPIGMVQRTGPGEFMLHLRPHDNATPEEILNTPGIPIDRKDAGRLDTASKKFERDDRATAEAERQAARQDNIRNGRTNPGDVARRASASPPPQDDPARRGMPTAVAQEEIPQAGADTLTVHKLGDQGDGDVVTVSSAGRAVTLTPEEVRGIGFSVSEADDVGWNVGESENLFDEQGFAYGKVTKTGASQYEVQVDGQPAFTLTPKGADALTSATDRVSAARRIQTEYGPTDFVPGPKGSVTLRTPGDDGRPVSVAMSAGAAGKLISAINDVGEGYDSDPGGSHRTDVPIGGGRKAVVEQVGDVYKAGSGGYVLLEADDGSWGIAVDSGTFSDWHDAFQAAVDASET